MSGFSSAPSGWRTLKKQDLAGMPPSLFFDVPNLDDYGMSTLRFWGAMSGRWDNHWTMLCLLDDTGAEIHLCHESFASGSFLFDLTIEKAHGVTRAHDTTRASTNGLATDSRTWNPQESRTWTTKNIVGIRIKAHHSGRFPMPEFGPSFIVIEGKP